MPCCTKPAPCRWHHAVPGQHSARRRGGVGCCACAPPRSRERAAAWSVPPVEGAGGGHHWSLPPWGWVPVEPMGLSNPYPAKEGAPGAAPPRNRAPHGAMHPCSTVGVPALHSPPRHVLPQGCGEQRCPCPLLCPGGPGGPGGGPPGVRRVPGRLALRQGCVPGECGVSEGIFIARGSGSACRGGAAPFNPSLPPRAAGAPPCPPGSPLPVVAAGTAGCRRPQLVGRPWGSWPRAQPRCPPQARGHPHRLAAGPSLAWPRAVAPHGDIPPRPGSARRAPCSAPAPRCRPSRMRAVPGGVPHPLPPRPPAAPQLPAPPCSAALAGPGCSRSAAERRCGSPRLSDVCRARAGTREGRGRRRGARRGQPAGRAAAARSEVRARLCRSRDPPGAVAAAGGVSGHRGLGLAFSGSLERVRGLRLGQDRALGAACQVPAGGPGTRPPPCCWGFPAAGSFGCSGPRASQCGTGDPSGLVRGDRR